MITASKKSFQYLKQAQKLSNKRITNETRQYIKGFAKYLDKSGYIGTDSSNLPSCQIAIITENNSHLTGGRYYCYMLGAALVEAGFDVRIYTNAAPPFLSFFTDYRLPPIEVIEGHADKLETASIDAEIYIGSPISGNLSAIYNGNRTNKPAYAMIFDPFPMMKKYLDKDGWTGWDEIVKRLSTTDTKIITLCESTKPYAAEWLSRKTADMVSIYPCINSRVADRIQPQPRERFALFISRIVPNKRFDHVLYACRQNNVRLIVISSASGVYHDQMIAEAGMEGMVEILWNASEEQKFALIKQAAVIINGAVFEGFGMWAAEAIHCGTPLVCYDYETLHEIAQHSKAEGVFFAKHGDMVDLSNKLSFALTGSYHTSPQPHFAFDAMVKRAAEVFAITPKIGVLMIALNEEKWIKKSIESVITHPAIHKIAVVEGAVEDYPTHRNYLSVDHTHKQIFELMEGEYAHKIIYERYGKARDKSELRNRALELLTHCTHVLIVDADELYTTEDLDVMEREIGRHFATQAYLYPHLHYWKSYDQITTGSQWDTPLPRLFAFSDKGIRFQKHNNFPVNSRGIRLDKVSLLELPIHCHHFGYVKPENRIQEKLEYYQKRDIELTVTDTYTNWKPGEPTQPTHGGGIVVPYMGPWPMGIATTHSI